VLSPRLGPLQCHHALRANRMRIAGYAPGGLLLIEKYGATCGALDGLLQAEAKNSFHGVIITVTRLPEFFGAALRQSPGSVVIMNCSYAPQAIAKGFGITQAYI
jgi:hypothetical protein